MASAAALTGATVVAIDARLPWDALFTILAAEAPRALIMSPRGPPLDGEAGEDRAAALAERFAPELARFTGGAVWGYDPLESKRFRALKYIVQTGFDDVPGVVQLADLASVGSGASSHAAHKRARARALANAAASPPPLARLARARALSARTQLSSRCERLPLDASPASPPLFLLLRADGEYDVDELISLHSECTPGDALTVQYSQSASGGQSLDRRQVTHAQALATAAAAGDAAGLARGDVVVLTAPLSSHFGFAAGALAAMRAGAKLGA